MVALKDLGLTKPHSYGKISMVVGKIIGKVDFQLQVPKLENGRGRKQKSRL
jgi:hypothetical protein